MATSSFLGLADCAAERSGTITCDTPARRAARSATPSQPAPASQAPVSPRPRRRTAGRSRPRPSATGQRPAMGSPLFDTDISMSRTRTHRGRRRTASWVEQGKPARTQVPVLRDEGGGDPDDEQVVGVGEDPIPGSGPPAGGTCSAMPHPAPRSGPRTGCQPTHHPAGHATGRMPAAGGASRGGNYRPQTTSSRPRNEHEVNT